MNKLTWAALLALPLLAICQQRATADGFGLLGGKCADGSCSAGAAPSYGGCATCGKAGCATCGQNGCGYKKTACEKLQDCMPYTLGIAGFLNSPPPWARWGCKSCSAGPGHNDCKGIVPGPWYLYWPDPSGAGIQTGPAYGGRWTLENHFTGHVMGFGPAVAAPQYPSYWYGR
jgi:hypothetical protein